MSCPIPYGKYTLNESEPIVKMNANRKTPPPRLFLYNYIIWFGSWTIFARSKVGSEGGGSVTTLTDGIIRDLGSFGAMISNS